MEYFTFVDKCDLSERGQFANDVCQLIVDANDRCITRSLEQVEKFHDHFETHVRNVYELIDYEIPLFSLYYLMKHGKDNFGFSTEEYNNCKIKALRACVKYYRIDLRSVIEWEEKNV